MIQRSLDKKRSGQGGFTLVELLIVIVILGILAAIVVLAIGGLQGTAKTANCNAGVKTIESAEDAFFAQGNNAYGTGAQLWDGGAAATKLLKTDPAGTFTITTPTTQTYLIHGIGDCSAMADVAGP